MTSGCDYLSVVLGDHLDLGLSSDSWEAWTGDLTGFLSSLPVTFDYWDDSEVLVAVGPPVDRILGPPAPPRTLKGRLVKRLTGRFTADTVPDEEEVYIADYGFNYLLLRRVEVLRGSGAIGVHVEAPPSQGGRFPWTDEELERLRALGMKRYEHQLSRFWEMPGPAKAEEDGPEQAAILLASAAESARTIAAIFRDVLGDSTPEHIRMGMMTT